MGKRPDRRGPPAPVGGNAPRGVLTTIQCPFCSGKVGLPPPSNTSLRIAHTLPTCEKFDKEDALTFIHNVRMATVGPVADDDEWPPPSNNNGGETS